MTTTATAWRHRRSDAAFVCSVTTERDTASSERGPAAIWENPDIERTISPIRFWLLRLVNSFHVCVWPGRIIHFLFQPQLSAAVLIVYLMEESSEQRAAAGRLEILCVP